MSHSASAGIMWYTETPMIGRSLVFLSALPCFFSTAMQLLHFFRGKRPKKSSSGNIPSSKSSMLDKLGKSLNVRFQLPLGFDVAVVSGFGVFVKPVPGSVGSIGSKFWCILRVWTFKKTRPKYKKSFFFKNRGHGMILAGRFKGDAEGIVAF